MKKNLFYGVLAIVVLQMIIACGGNTAQEKPMNQKAGTKLSKASLQLQQNYDAWFELKNQTVEYYRLIVAEVEPFKGAWSKEELNIAIFENKTNGDRAGFFQLGNDYYLSVKEAKELIQVLENVNQQINHESCRYSCTRCYSTSFGVTVRYNYISSDTHKWDEVSIYAENEEACCIDVTYFTKYLQGLKDCVQAIDKFVAGQWSNKVDNSQ